MAPSESPDNPKQDKGQCPICRAVRKDDAHAPFCSKRCRQIDLGRWLDGRYLVSRPIEQSDIEEGE